MVGNGWDTDQFPNNAQELLPSLVQLVEDKGFTTGGFNFDAKLRRQSVDPAELYLGHIGGIDTIARALLTAADVVESGDLARLKSERCRGWSGELGRRIAGGELNLETLADLATAKGFNPTPRSGRQELAESLIARTCKY